MASPATTKTGTVASGGNDAPHGSGFPPFQSETYASQLLWLAITFGVLYWLADKVIVPRLGGILADRASRIGNDLNEAAAMKAKAEDAVAAYEKSLAGARAKSQAIAQETRDKVNAKSDARRKSVESDLAAKLADAESKIVAMKSGAMANVAGIAAETASAIVAQLTGTAPSKAVADDAVKTTTKGVSAMLLQNPTFWVLVSTVIFLGVPIYMGAAKAVTAALDKRGEMIAAELAEARRLREEAAAILAAYEAKRKAAEAEAEQIVNAAREDAKRLAKDSEAKLAEFVTRRTKSAEEKISQAEVQAEAEVRTAAAEAATRAAEVILRSQIAGKAEESLFAAALKEIKTKLN